MHGSPIAPVTQRPARRRYPATIPFFIPSEPRAGTATTICHTPMLLCLAHARHSYMNGCTVHPSTLVALAQIPSRPKRETQLLRRGHSARLPGSDCMVSTHHPVDTGKAETDCLPSPQISAPASPARPRRASDLGARHSMPAPSTGPTPGHPVVEGLATPQATIWTPSVPPVIVRSDSDGSSAGDDKTQEAHQDVKIARLKECPQPPRTTDASARVQWLRLTSSDNDLTAGAGPRQSKKASVTAR